MISEWISKVSGVLIFVVSLFAHASGTWVENVFEFLHFGWFIAFCSANNEILITFLAILFVLRWIKDWRWLVAIGAVVYVTLHWGL